MKDIKSNQKESRNQTLVESLLVLHKKKKLKF